MPPVHPAILHIPIALILFAFVTDLLGYIYKSQRLAVTGYFALIGAVVGFVFTIAAGYFDIDTQTLAETDRYVDFHMTVGWILFGSAAALLFWRWRIFRLEDHPVGGRYLIAAGMVLALTMFQGWYGAEMVYSQGAGVAAAGKGTESPIAGRLRLDRVTFNE